MPVSRRNPSRNPRRSGQQKPGPNTTVGNRFHKIVDYFNDLYDSDDDEPDIRVMSVEEDRANNGILHHTDEFDDKYCVVRRGQMFVFKIRFNKEFDENYDLRFIFTFGKNPMPTKGTEVSLVLSDDDVQGQWGVEIGSRKGNYLEVGIMTPPTCFVGKWNMAIHTMSTGAEKIFRYVHPTPIHVLFNPWLEADTVYMKEAEKMKEYVLNEAGRIYVGSQNRISGRHWNFGQFENDVLECVMYLLDELSPMKDNVRGNPINVTRKLSALVNGNDDNGVLTGRWRQPYTGGTRPTAWNGSVAIIKEYMNTKNSVLYGQCWVFSGVTTTLCRCLGIPTRSVTNFQSAHDSDGSTTIDYYIDEEGEMIDGDDSVWNFHVWNECYFARPDLPEGYGGWQAIDATPQEASDGVMCMGPCSVAAMKDGAITLPYDGAFLFAEVNSDSVWWEMGRDRRCSEIWRYEDSTGIHISTKAVNSNEREDITHLYKHKEGTDANRNAVARAGLYGKRVGEARWEKKDVEFKLVMDHDTYLGAPVMMSFSMKNTSNDSRTVLAAKVHVNSCQYTGHLHEHIETYKIQETKLEPGDEKTYKLQLDFNTYNKHLADQCFLKLSYIAKVIETHQVSTDTIQTRLRKPHLTIKAPAKTKLMKAISVDVSFINPLEIPLTNCSLSVEGPGFGTFTIRQGSIAPKATYSIGFDQIPSKVGKKTLAFIFNSDELLSVDEACEILVEK